MTRSTRVSNTGDSGAPSAASATAASAPSGSAPSSSRRPPGAGTSVSRCEKRPFAARPASLRLIVCTQDRPTRRNRSDTPAAASAFPAVS